MGAVGGPSTEGRVVNAMTIDVEDYFHASVFDRVVDRNDWHLMPSRLCANTDRILRLLDQAGVLATFFVLGTVADQFPGLVRQIAAAGHEVASHGYGHRLIYEQTEDAFREDIRHAKGVLESVIGAPVFGYRAPSYSVTRRSLWALDILVEEGHTYDASIFPIHHDRYGVADAPRHAYRIQRDGGALLEIPPSTVRVGPVNVPVGGGGYFRLLPYAWTRWGIRRVNEAERQPALFYLHPWELDPDQPRLPVGAVSRWRHYGNLAIAESRFVRLLREFAFAPLRDVFPTVLSLSAAASITRTASFADVC